jgi:hypothetical protein
MTFRVFNGLEVLTKPCQGHVSGLGKVRWMVERTISWLKGLPTTSAVRPTRGDHGRLGNACD